MNRKKHDLVGQWNGEKVGQWDSVRYGCQLTAVRFPPGTVILNAVKNLGACR